MPRALAIPSTRSRPSSSESRTPIQSATGSTTAATTTYARNRFATRPAATARSACLTTRCGARTCGATSIRTIVTWRPSRPTATSKTRRTRPPKFTTLSLPARSRISSANGSRQSSRVHRRRRLRHRHHLLRHLRHHPPNHHHHLHRHHRHPRSHRPSLLLFRCHLPHRQALSRRLRPRRHLPLQRVLLLLRSRRFPLAQRSPSKLSSSSVSPRAADARPPRRRFEALEQPCIASCRQQMQPRMPLRTTAASPRALIPRSAA